MRRLPKIMFGGAIALAPLAVLASFLILRPGERPRGLPAINAASVDSTENTLNPTSVDEPRTSRRKKDRDVSIVMGLDPAGSRKGKATPVPTVHSNLVTSSNVVPTPRPSSAPTATLRVSEEPRGLLAALEDAGDRQPDTRVIFGPGDTITTTTTESAPARPAPTAEAAPEPALDRVSGQPRGYAALYLMQPTARVAVDREIDTMLKAEVNEQYLGVLTDGTFGKDLPYLTSVVNRLNSGGRTLTLSLYLTNGATMREWDRTPISAGFNQIEPAQFRYLIRYDPGTRSRFRNMVSEVLPIFELNSRLNPGNRNIAVVMLEDNLDAEAYYQMRELARSVIGQKAEFVRNPCLGCYEGNDGDTLGDPIEVHAVDELVALKAGDGFTLDGLGFAFPGEQSGRMGVDSLKELLAFGKERSLGYFGLWRLERQGLLGGKSVHPDDRLYEVQSDAQQAIEIEMLRHGLLPKNKPPA
jgi:hypothetical protein